MDQDDQRKQMGENWKEFASSWAKWTPPAKPSPAEIEYWEKELLKMIEQNKNIKALVLGSTPEFRDFLAKHKIDTTIVDVNPVMIQAMNSLISIPNANEKTVISDWLSMPFYENSFDLVLSDDAQDNIKYEEFEKFFEKVFSVLKPGGKWFFGAINLNRGNTLSFDEYIGSYKKDPENFKDFRNFILSIFRLAYNPEFYDEKKRSYDFQKVEDKIRSLAEKGELPEEAIKDLTLGIDYQMPVLNKEEFKKIIGKNFTVDSEFEDRSHPAMQIKWTAILSPNKS